MAEIKIDESVLKPNSHKYKEERQKKKTEPVVSKDDIVSTKKGLGKKISETFIKEDLRDIRNYVIFDLIIPQVKDTLLDTIEMILCGRNSGRSSYGQSYYNSYNSYYNSPNDQNKRRNRRDERRDDRTPDCRNVVLSNRDAAERIIGEMHGRIRYSGSVSVAELFDLVGVSSAYTDNNWGWDNENDIRIRRVTNGFLIDVQEPIYIG